jgi:membrane fusion protein (multidrug efflux system)
MDMNQKRESPFNRTKMRIFILILLIACLGLGIYFGGRWLFFRWHYVSTDDAQVKGNLINLSAKVPGRIVRLLVEEGDTVKVGQVLVEIEKEDHAAAQTQANANLEIAKHELAKAITQLSLTKERVSQGIETARASLREAQEVLKSAEDDAALQTDRVNKEIDRAQASYHASLAKVAETKVTMESTRKEFARIDALFRQKFVPENSRDASEAAWQVAKSKYEGAMENEREALSQLEMAKANQRSIILKEQNIRVAEQVLQKAHINLIMAEEEKKQIALQEREIELLQAKIREAEAAFHLADIRLKETEIFSPINGVISRRLAEEGQIVQIGQPILVVNDPGEKWVVANVGETKVRRVRKGAKVNIEADAFPGHVFEGQVESIGAAAISEFALLPSDNPSGNFIKITQRLPVRIFVRDPENLLKPGMMVVVTIEARS